MLASNLLQANDDVLEEQRRASDERLFEWCLSYFPFEDQNKAPLPRPAKKLAPLKLEELATPPDLVTNTQIAGKLPWYVEKYQGTWIWPTASESPSFAMFVERLSATEITVALAVRPAEGTPKTAYKYLRERLKWTGKEFAHTKPAGPNEKPTRLSLHVSPFGHAMLWLTEVRNEAWPMCFISSKHY